MIRTRSGPRGVLLLLLTLAAACGGGEAAPPDAGTADAGTADAGTADAGPDAGLPPTGRVAGRVTRADRAAGHAGIRVELEGFSPAAETEFDGAFELDGVPAGLWRLTATAEGYLPASVDEVDVQGGGTTSVPDLVLQPLPPPGALRGAVRLFGLADHAGTVVQLRDAGGSLAGEQVTGSDGRFTFEGLEAGVYRVSWAHPPWPEGFGDVEVDRSPVEHPAVTLHLARRIHERPATPQWLDARWALLSMAAGASPRYAVYDAVAGAAMDLPHDDARIVSRHPDSDELLVYVPGDTGPGEVLALRPGAGETSVVASGMKLLASGETTLLADDAGVYTAGAGRPLTLLAASPCQPTWQSHGAAPLPEAPGWYRLGWACSSSPGTYAHPETGRITGHVGPGGVLGGGRWLVFLQYADPLSPSDSQPATLKRLDTRDGTETVVLEDLRYVGLDLEPSGGGAPVVRYVDAGYRPLLARLDADTAQVDAVVEDVGTFLRRDETVWIIRSSDGALLHLPGDATQARLACHGRVKPQELTLWTDAALCRKGGGYGSPWDYYQYQAGGDPELLATGVTEQYGLVLGEALLYRVGADQLWGVDLTAGAGPTPICTGERFVPHPRGRFALAWCRTAETDRVVLHDLVAGTGLEVASGPQALGELGSLVIDPEGRGVAFTYALSTLGTGWDCGGAACAMVWHRDTGERVVRPTDGLAVTGLWSADGTGLVLSGGGGLHVDFTGEGPVRYAEAELDLGSPVALGPSGRYGLWRSRSGAAVSVTDVSTGGRETVDHPYWDDVYGTADPSVWLTRMAAIDLVTGEVVPHGPLGAPLFSVSRDAALLSQEGVLWRWALGGSGLERMGDVMPVEGGPRPAWLLDGQAAGRWWLALFDAASARPVRVVEGAEPQVETLEPEARYLVRHAWGGPELDLCVLDVAGQTCAPLASQVVAEAPVWIPPLEVQSWPGRPAEPLPPGPVRRVAFNALRGEGVRLTMAELDGSGEADLGPAADDVVFALDGSGVAFEAGGMWWLPGFVAGEAVPFEEAEGIGQNVAVAPGGGEAIYGKWDGERVGTWVVSGADGAP